MNYELLNRKMAKFFEATTLEKLVNDLKEKGYTFSSLNCMSDNDFEHKVSFASTNDILNIPSATYIVDDPDDYSYTMAA